MLAIVSIAPPARRACALVALALSAALGCDAAAPVLAPDAAVAPEIAPPAPPRFPECAPGFVRDTGRSSCVAIATTASSCPPGEARFLASDECGRVGPECPADGWPDPSLLGTGPILYVDVAAAPGGDGTRERPLASLAAALTGSGARTAALRAGTYDGQAVLTAGASIVGACAERTILRGRAGSPPTSAIAVSGAGTRVRSVTVTGDGAGILAYEGSLALEDVIIDRVMVGGLVTLGAVDITARRLAVRAIRGDASSDPWGYGIVLGSGSHADIRDVSVHATEGTGIVVSDAGTVLEASDVLITEAATNAADYGGGLRVELSGAAHLERVALLATSECGAVVTDDAELTMIDAHIATTRAHRGRGCGVSVQGSSRGDLSRIVVSDAPHAGIIAAQGSTLVLRDAVIHGVRPTEERPDVGQALVIDASTATIERLSIDGSIDFGVVIVAGTVELTDVAIGSTSSNATTGFFGRGLHVDEGSDLHAVRLAIEDSREAHVVVAASSFRGEDVLLRGVAERACALDGCAGLGGGHGVFVGDGALELERFVIDDCALSGIFFAGGTLRLTDGIVQRAPIGLNVQTDAYDPDSIDRVRFVDTDRNLARESIAPPEPAPRASL
jgi:hypothetical protein